MAGERFRSAFTLAKFALPATLAVTAAQWIRLGSYQVAAGEYWKPGYGAQSGQENAVGRIFAKFFDTTAGTPLEIPGTIRLTIYSPQDRPLKIMFEFRTEALNTSAADRTKQTPWAESVEVITRDKKIVLEFLPDNSATLSRANSALIMDMTQGVA